MKDGKRENKRLDGRMKRQRGMEQIRTPKSDGEREKSEVGAMMEEKQTKGRISGEKEGFRSGDERKCERTWGKDETAHII